MARGNNLSPGGKKQAKSDQYVEGFIESSTYVWMVPGTHSGNMLQSYVSRTWMTVCVSSMEEGVEQEWLCVVNPGVGFGHIRGSDISEWRSRPPGQPSIRSVRIGALASSERSVNQQVQDERVMRLLSVMGGSLTALDWQGIRHLATFQVFDLRIHCPCLKYLRIDHDGAVWADPSETTSWPELEELELDLTNKTNLPQRREVRLQAASLPKLKALRLKVEKNAFASSKDTVQQILNDHGALEFLWWSSKRVSISLTLESERTAKLEFERHVQEMALDVVRPPLQLARRLAFLSVVEAKASSRTVNFGPDLSALVFSFEPSVLPREIFIDV